MIEIDEKYHSSHIRNELLSSQAEMITASQQQVSFSICPGGVRKRGGRNGDFIFPLCANDLYKGCFEKTGSRALNPLED